MKHFWQIALVQLQHVRNRIEIQIVIFEMLPQVVECFEVCVQPLLLRICHEHHSIRALQNQSPARLIEHLPRNGIQMKTSAKSAHGSQVERKKIEEKSAIRLSRQRHHLSLLIRSRVLIDPLEIRGLPAEAGTIVDKLAVNFARGKINKRHNFLSFAAEVTYSTGSHHRQRDRHPLLRN